MARRKGIPTINMAEANWKEQLDSVFNTSKVKPTTETYNSLKTEADSIRDEIKQKGKTC